MSTVILGACWPLVMSPAQKAVLISLADQASDDGVCWPAVGSIAKRTCLSPRAVQDAINWLETAGVVKREFRHNKSTSYTIRPSAYKPEAASTVRVRKAKPSTRRGANGAPPADGAGGADAAGGAPDAPPHADGAPPPADGAPPGVQGAHPEPSLNRKGTTKEPSPRPAAPTGGEGQAGQLTEQEALQAACRATWDAYRQAFEARYAVKPVRNATVNTQVKQLVTRIGREDAPQVAAFFVERIEDQFVVRDCHSVGQLLAKAEAYRTQWAMGRPVAARPPATGETAYQRQMRERVEEACPALARQAPGAATAAADVIDIAPAAAAPAGMAARVAALLNR